VFRQEYRPCPARLARPVVAARLWKARPRAAGDFRGNRRPPWRHGTQPKNSKRGGARSELHLVAALFARCAREHHAVALQELDLARAAAGESSGALRTCALTRIDVWRAELAYYQGRYSETTDLVDRLSCRISKDNAIGHT